MSEFEEMLDGLIDTARQAEKHVNSIGLRDTAREILEACREEFIAKFANQDQRIATLEASLCWIPVSERLPNEDYCIAIVEYLSGHRTRKLLRFENNRGFGLYDMESDNIDGWVNYNDNVTHWMPLPNPPELPTPEVSE